MLTIALANHKGGTGKTATAHALGACLAADGLRVLLVDVDPQSSLTAASGFTDGLTLADVLGESGKAQLSDVVQYLGDGLCLAPSDIALATVEQGLVTRLGREGVLRKTLARAEGFDVCLIDCPPSLGLLTVNALVAADAVLIPTQPQAADLRGLRLFLETLEKIRAELNPDLETLGILVTFYDNRLNHHKEAVEAMNSAGLNVLPVMVGRSVRVAEAAAHGQPVTTYEPRNPQAEAYRELARTVTKWQNGKRT